jgi:hypothetical protein
MAPAADSWNSFVRGLRSEQVIDVAVETVEAPERAGQMEVPALPNAPIMPNQQSASVEDQQLTP